MLRKTIFLIFVLLLVVGGCVTGYGYWLENSANRIVGIELPYQEDLVIQYETELNILEHKASQVHQRWEHTEKAYNDYVQSEYDYLIETGASMLIPLPPVISELSTLSTIGNLLSHAKESTERLNEFLEAKEEYHKEYQALQREIEHKKNLISDMNKKIAILRADADRKKKNAPIAGYYGKLLLGIGAFGLFLSAFKRRKR